MTSSPLAQLARMFDDVEASLRQAGPLPEALDTIVGHAVQLVGAADAAGISVSRSGAWRTMASSGPLPLQVDTLHTSSATALACTPHSSTPPSSPTTCRITPGGPSSAPGPPARPASSA
jgi:hypothetical protein